MVKKNIYIWGKNKNEHYWVPCLPCCIKRAIEKTPITSEIPLECSRRRKVEEGWCLVPYSVDTKPETYWRFKLAGNDGTWWFLCCTCLVLMTTWWLHGGWYMLQMKICRESYGETCFLQWCPVFFPIGFYYPSSCCFCFRLYRTILGWQLLGKKFPLFKYISVWHSQVISP